MSEIINFEIKARCCDPDQVRDALKSKQARFVGVDNQLDTYFNSTTGRLKLRAGNIENSLIYYEREDSPGARGSAILLEKLSQESNLREILLASIGEKISVKKSREIYYIENVKFHIDEVEGLGAFIEIEAIGQGDQFTMQELKEQCIYFINLLELKKKDFIRYSYSDLVVESFESRIRREACEFLDLLSAEMLEARIDFSQNLIDHLCYRVTTEAEYIQYKNLFLGIGEELIESEVGGRLISTFKLYKPLLYKDREIDVVELTSPKSKNKYALGFEHAEFVVTENFQIFIDKYPKVEFDLTALSKKINPDIRIDFKSGQSIKLHHQSLELIIEYEKTVT